MKPSWNWLWLVVAILLIVWLLGQLGWVTVSVN